MECRWRCRHGSGARGGGPCQGGAFWDWVLRECCGVRWGGGGIGDVKDISGMVLWNPMLFWKGILTILKEVDLDLKPIHGFRGNDRMPSLWWQL